MRNYVRQILQDARRRKGYIYDFDNMRDIHKAMRPDDIFILDTYGDYWSLRVPNVKETTEAFLNYCDKRKLDASKAKSYERFKKAIRIIDYDE